MTFRANTIVICEPVVPSNLKGGRRPFCIVSTSASSNSPPVHEVIHSGASWPCRVPLQVGTGPGAPGIVTLQIGLIGLQDDISNIVVDGQLRCPAARVDVPLCKLNKSVAVWLGLEFLDSPLQERLSNSEILQQYQFAQRAAMAGTVDAKICVLLKATPSSTSSIAPSPIKAQSDILGRSFGALSMDSDVSFTLRSQRDGTEFFNSSLSAIQASPLNKSFDKTLTASVLGSSPFKEKSVSSFESSARAATAGLELLPTPRLREEVQRLKDRKRSNEALEVQSVKAASAVVERLEDQLRDLQRIHQDLDEQAKKERCQQDQAQSVLRDMIKQELSHKQETDKKTQDLYDDKTRVVHELNEKHRQLAEQQATVQKRFDDDLRQSKLLEEEYKRIQDTLAETHKRLEVSEIAALKGAKERCSVADLEVDGDKFQRDQDEIDTLEAELLRLQAERDQLLESPQTARRARLTEASKMEADVAKIEAEIETLSAELQQVNDECESVKLQLAQERETGEKLVEENLAKVTDEEKLASVAMTQELEDYLRDEVRPLQAENRRLKEEYAQDRKRMEDEIAAVTNERNLAKDVVDRHTLVLDKLVEDVRAVEIATEKATKIAQEAGATPDLPKRVGDVLQEEQNLINEIKLDEEGLDNCPEIRRAEENLAEMRRNLMTLEQRCQDLDDDMSAAARQRQAAQQALFEQKPKAPRCAESPPRRTSRINRLRRNESGDGFSFRTGRSRSPTYSRQGQASVTPTQRRRQQSPQYSQNNSQLLDESELSQIQHTESNLMERTPGQNSNPEQIVSSLQQARSLVSKHNNFSLERSASTAGLISSKNVHVQRTLQQKFDLQNKQLSHIHEIGTSSLQTYEHDQPSELQMDSVVESPDRVVSGKSNIDLAPRGSIESISMPIPSHHSSPFHSAREESTGEQQQTVQLVNQDSLDVRSPLPGMQENITATPPHLKFQNQPHYEDSSPARQERSFGNRVHSDSNFSGTGAFSSGMKMRMQEAIAIHQSNDSSRRMTRGRFGSGASSSLLHDADSARSSREGLANSVRPTISSKNKSTVRPVKKTPQKTMHSSPAKSTSGIAVAPRITPGQNLSQRSQQSLSGRKSDDGQSPVRPSPVGPPAQPKIMNQTPPSGVKPKSAPLRKSAAFLHPAHAEKLGGPARSGESLNLAVPNLGSPEQNSSRGVTNSNQGRPQMAVRKGFPPAVPGQQLHVVHRPPGIVRPPLSHPQSPAAPHAMMQPPVQQHSPMQQLRRPVMAQVPMAYHQVPSTSSSPVMLGSAPTLGPPSSSSFASGGASMMMGPMPTMSSFASSGASPLTMSPAAVATFLPYTQHVMPQHRPPRRQ